ncbi:hypothetical protein [Ornithinimicrobium kibberense]
MLSFDETSQGAEVVAEGEMTGGRDAGQVALHGHGAGLLQG